MPSYPPQPVSSPHGSVFLPALTSSSESLPSGGGSRPQKRQRTHSSNSSVAGTSVGTLAGEYRAHLQYSQHMHPGHGVQGVQSVQSVQQQVQQLQQPIPSLQQQVTGGGQVQQQAVQQQVQSVQQQHQQQLHHQPSHPAVSSGAVKKQTTNGVPASGKYPTANGSYQQNMKMNGKVQQKSQQQQQSYRSPVVAHANVGSLGFGGDPGVGAGGMGLERDEDVPPSLRAREEGATETFAIPMCKDWEELSTHLQCTFNKSGDPKIMNSRGDTIARAMIPRFLLNGMLFVVAFPSGSHAPVKAPPPPPPPAPVARVQPISASNPASDLVVGINGTTNGSPSTPYSPPTAAAMATPTVYPTANNTRPPASPRVNTINTSNNINTPATATTGNNGTTPEGGASGFYRLSRNIKTVRELWEEWNNGLGPNQPSIVSLEKQFGPKWRSSTAERKFYSRRKVIIEEVNKHQKFGYTEEDALNMVEGFRGSKSLDSLSKELVKKRKGEEKDADAQGQTSTNANHAASQQQHTTQQNQIHHQQGLSAQQANQHASQQTQQVAQQQRQRQQEVGLQQRREQQRQQQQVAQSGTQGWGLS
ncbi:Similar to High-osmolarity-induced transcription protein 1; acc. no. Q6CR76 [Pyronema omphalodes CBS 100304]|uniref:Similar to High-osmolarity-induced transcription protein 1 acc. no. Q6CR76 n=1 Tax=Pyronema omphalodes (strain CBS 100304) TaxID=1076935 RepID=U4KYS1_PYROM|nr:Similar to High-osmolarity-induced transcription protein 1; acc. no. Q6CR76 [Pyronema omphalodes CBS 100304]